jgi:integrase/recombinase XerD
LTPSSTRCGWKRAWRSNTLAAYRRDLTLYARWLAQHGRGAGRHVEEHLNAYFAARHAQTRATTANRRLTVFKRYFPLGAARAP